MNRDMRVLFRSCGAFVLAILIVAVSSRGAFAAVPSEPFDLDRALAMPISPGSLALLVEHARDPRASDRLGRAFSHSDATVRAAAARVAFAAGLSARGQQALDALEREMNRSAAHELMRVVAASGPAGGAAVVDAARRLDMAYDAGIILAATLGPGSLEHLDELRPMTEGFPLARFLSLAARGDVNRLGVQLVKALREADVAFWSAFLETARESGATASRGSLIFGITTSNAEMRFETLWHLLQVLNSGTEMSPEVRETLQTATAGRGTVSDVEEAFVLELIARSGGEEPNERDLWTTMLRDGQTTRFTKSQLTHGDLLAVLTRGESRAVSESVRGDAKALDDAWERARKREGAATPRSARAPSSSKPVLRTAGGFPAGLVSDVLRVTGCDPKKTAEGFTVADLRFSLSGRPVAATFHIVQGAPADSESCDQAARVLILTSIETSRLHVIEGTFSRLLVPHSEPFFSCRGAASGTNVYRAGRSRADDGGAIVPPKKVKDVPPKYPESARQDRVQGLVILEATITPTGCVEAVRVLRSAEDRLDLAAVLAVSQWKYEPTLLNGQPVPIVVTVTVNFALS